MKEKWGGFCQKKNPQLLYLMTVLIILTILFILNPPSSFAIDDYVDFSESIIVVSKKMTKVEKKAIVVLQEEVYKRTGIQLKTITQMAHIITTCYCCR